jgi:hypothetical protein
VTELILDDAAQPVPRRPRPRRGALGARLAATAGRYNLVFLLLLSIAVYATWGNTSATFFTAPNFRNIVGSQTVLALLTLGLLLPLIAGQIDLSVGSIAGLSTILSAAAFANWHLPLWGGVLVGVGAGALVGVANGLIVTRLRVDPFITTLGTASVVVGIVEWYTNGLSIVQGMPRELITFGSGNWLGIPMVLYALALVAATVYYLIDHTPFGRSLNAIGVNREAARLVGIRIERVILLSRGHPDGPQRRGEPPGGAVPDPRGDRRRLPRGDLLPPRPGQRPGRPGRHIVSEREHHRTQPGGGARLHQRPLHGRGAGAGGGAGDHPWSQAPPRCGGGRDDRLDLGLA